MSSRPCDESPRSKLRPLKFVRQPGNTQMFTMFTHRDTHVHNRLLHVSPYKKSKTIEPISAPKLARGMSPTVSPTPTYEGVGDGSLPLPRTLPRLPARAGNLRTWGETPNQAKSIFRNEKQIQVLNWLSVKGEKMSFQETPEKGQTCRRVAMTGE